MVLILHEIIFVMFHLQGEPGPRGPRGPPGPEGPTVSHCGSVR